MLDASVGITTERDSLRAGKLVAKEALGGMKTKPKLAILVIDSLTRRPYKHEEVLKGVREELGPEVVLIGSTVNGIIVNKRFALRSIGLMLLGGDLNVDASYNYPKSRLEYEAIAKDLYNINSDLTSNDNRFLLMFQDGIKLPQEVLDKQKSLNSKFVSLFSGLVKRVFSRQLEEFREEGLGMPTVQEILEILYEKGFKYPVIGNVASNIRSYDSVEFYNDEIGKDNLVGATISGLGSTKFGFGFAAGAEPTGKECNIDKNVGSFLLKIDGEPALKGLCEAAGIQIASLEELRPGDYLNYHTIIGTRESYEGGNMTHLTATITDPALENLVNTGFPFDRVPEKMEIFKSDFQVLKKSTVASLEQALKNVSDPKFMLGFDCIIRFIAYGDNIPKIVDLIDDTIGSDVPRMIVGSGGEIFGDPKIDYYSNGVTFTSLVGGN